MGLSIPQQSLVSIKVINLLGQTVTWVQEPEIKPAGTENYFIEAADFKARGVYYVQISIDDTRHIKRLVVY